MPVVPLSIPAMPELSFVAIVLPCTAVPETDLPQKPLVLFGPVALAATHELPDEQLKILFWPNGDATSARTATKLASPSAYPALLHRRP